MLKGMSELFPRLTFTHLLYYNSTSRGCFNWNQLYFFLRKRNGLITIYFCFSALFFLISNVWRDYYTWRSVLCSGFSVFSTRKLCSTRKNAQQWELGADDRRMWYHHPTIFCSPGLSICSATFIILQASWELLPKSQKVSITNPAL